MLEELRIQNFAIIDELELSFAPGFNVITGETGAGKSIIIDAVELLLGSKADTGAVRTGADKAVIEGTFALHEQARLRVLPMLEAEELIEEGETPDYVTLTREVRRTGRSTARINGVVVKADLLREVGGALVDIHGQSTHLSLFRPRSHVNLLDRYADLLEVRDALGNVVHTLQDIRREINSLESDTEALKRRAERLRYEIDEIEAAALKTEGSNDNDEVGDEESDLVTERNRLANSEQLATLAAQAVTLLSGDEAGESADAVDLLMQVAALMGRLAKIDPSLDDDYTLAEEISTNAQELALTLSGYADEIEFSPSRLDEVEERLELIKSLKRRYKADNIQGVLDYAARASEELNGIEHSDERLLELREKEEKTLRHIGELAQRISRTREQAGRKLAEGVVRELQDLRMAKTEFVVQMLRTEDEHGCYIGSKRYTFDATGVDNVEFLMSANPGEPPRPLAKVASGGEAARIMLALKRVLTQADETPLLIFDEIDQGIGGRIGGIVGEKLWSLSNGHQVMVVTHLPQLAGYGDQHFKVHKHVKGKRTITQVNALAQDKQRIEELAAMLGAQGESGLQSAREILEAARERKQHNGSIPTNIEPTQQSLL
jgi:DNA repair protein RecN (Recombination protein N)